MLHMWKIINKINKYKSFVDCVQCDSTPLLAFASKYALVMKSASDDGVITDWGNVENVFNPEIVSSPVFITAPAAATSAASVPPLSPF